MMSWKFLVPPYENELLTLGALGCSISEPEALMPTMNTIDCYLLCGMLFGMLVITVSSEEHDWNNGIKSVKG